MGYNLSAVGRLIARRRLYIFGTFAWLVTGSLLATGFSWSSHAQGVSIHTPTPVVATHIPVKPEVAGAETTAPSVVLSTPTPPPAPAQGSTLLHISKVMDIASTPTTHNAPSLGADPAPTPPPAPAPLPSLNTPPALPVDPTPTPVPTPVPTPPVCTVDPLLAFSILGNNAVTVVAGSQSVPQTLTTSDSSSVVWSPTTATQWSDGTSTDVGAAVKVVVGFLPTTATGPNVTYTVQALSTATPGNYTVTWHVADTTRSLCYDTSIQVVVTAPPVVTPVTP